MYSAKYRLALSAAGVLSAAVSVALFTHVKVAARKNEEAYRLFHAGVSYTKAAKYRLAEGLLERSAALKPEFELSRRWLGIAQVGAGDYRQAISTLNGALKLPRSSPPVEYYYIGNAYLGIGDLDQARAAWEAMGDYADAPESGMSRQQLARWPSHKSSP